MLKNKTITARQEKIYSYLEENKVDAVILADLEGLRDKSLRYLSGHPQDALLFLFAEGRSILVPWDVALAEKNAAADRIIPYTDYNRSFTAALEGVLKEQRLGPESSLELSGQFSFPTVTEVMNLLPKAGIKCEKQGIDSFLLKQRSVKEAGEMESIRRAAGITNRIIEEIEGLLRESKVTESDLALLIEAEARKMGAEGTGFETLAASSARSFAIHAFPSFSAEPFGGNGFSILDFGVRFSGYNSDVTLTVVRGTLDRMQEEMARAVKDAYDLALSLVKPGEMPSRIAQSVEALFSERGFRMPHSLGHGLGLDVHEQPLLRSDLPEDSWEPLSPGMVFTIEPGLYHPGAGGIRLENDLLLTTGGAEVLTKARLIYIDNSQR